MAGATGLDYVAAYRVAETIGVQVDDAVLTFLQELEAEQLEEFQARSERERGKAGKRG